MSGTGAGNSNVICPGIILCIPPALFVVLISLKMWGFFLNFGSEDEIPLHCIFIPFCTCHCLTEKMNLIMNYHVPIAPLFPSVPEDLCSLLYVF